ncbi:rhomboid family intramembrane serine protease [Pedobacter sp. LMG 31464]|uniref:Rhomboid family intramembrane serine protease n=1 Tax=Pedobacter planticolens TaxID=2679964 RepID=A0A923DZ05_9SPHI|nr:rhomboid family intramembrane serine protease [Pedobacter planticolens]
MVSNLWLDFKLKFFKSDSVVLPYIGINTIIFVLVSIFSLISFLAGQQGFITNLINEYITFPASSNLWLTRFYTVLTYQFFHADFFHVLFNMLWLYWMGQLFLDFLKPRQFHFVYFAGGVFGAIFFALIYNVLPAYKSFADSAILIGASASVMAIFTAITTLVPNFSIHLLLIGPIRIKYLLAVYIFLDIIAIEKFDGGSLSHLGGALLGFIYIKLLQNGTDITKIFERKPKLKVVRNENVKKQEFVVNQKEIDAILDKISKTGYDKLSRDEKETLFKASKN